MSNLIYFVETQPSEREYFAQALSEENVQFVDGVEEVGADAELISIYIQSEIGVPFLVKHPNVKLITTRSTGYDHIDLQECQRRGVTVCNIHSADEVTVAEHTFALMLALSRRLFEACEANKQPVFDYEALRGFDLAGKTLGVIGTGRVGRRVIDLALAFGMKVLAYDRHRYPLIGRHGVRYSEINDVLRESDILTLHTPLTNETRHLLDREAFQQCREGVIVINTARGGLIDTNALIWALNEGIVDAAGIDVLEDERPMRKDASRVIAEQIVERVQQATFGSAASSTKQRVEEVESLYKSKSLLSLPNVVFTPHVAFNSIESIERINAVTVENIKAFLKGAPINLVSAFHENDNDAGVP